MLGSTMPTDSAYAPVRTTASDTGHASVDTSVHDRSSVTVANIDRSRVHQLVADLARNLVHAITGAYPYELELHEHLSYLAALAAIRTAADELSADIAATAAAAGASYVNLGDAVGTTRQNARVRWPGLVIATRRKTGTADENSTRVEGC